MESNRDQSRDFSISAALRRQLAKREDGVTVAELVARKIIELAMDGNPEAIRIIHERVVARKR